MLFIKQRTLLAGTAARRTCLLSLTATVTAVAEAETETEAAHTTHTTARGHQARRHDSTTARGHEDNDLVSQGIAFASSPPHASSLPPSLARSFASLRVRRRFVSPRIASQRSASAFLVHNASESDNATASQSLSLPMSLSLLILGTVSRLLELYACRLHC